MIIIVEGPDGAGKTTAINKLVAQHNGSSKAFWSSSNG